LHVRLCTGFIRLCIWTSGTNESLTYLKEGNFLISWATGSFSGFILPGRYSL